MSEKSIIWTMAVIQNIALLTASTALFWHTDNAWWFLLLLLFSIPNCKENKDE